MILHVHRDVVNQLDLKELVQSMFVNVNERRRSFFGPQKLGY